jgi:hypothetical protein
MLKKSKSNKYLSNLAIKSGSVKIEKLKYISIYDRLKDPLEFSSAFILNIDNINSFDTCIEFLKSNKDFSYRKITRLLDVCWNKYVISNDSISDVVVNYYKSFSNIYWPNFKKYNYNMWNNILYAYFEENKSRWIEIVFHTYKIKLFSEKY